MITTSYRTLFATFAFTLAAGCAVDSSEPEPMPDEPMPGEPMPGEPTPAAGDVDATFGIDGVKTLALGSGYASAIVPQGDKLLACATIIDGANWVAKVIRLDTNGELDPTFATEGVLELAQANSNVTCRSLSVRADGSFVFAGRVLGANDVVNVWSSDGKTRYQLQPFSTAISKASAGPGDTLFAVGKRHGAVLAITSVSADNESISDAPAPIDGSITRAFERPGVGRFGVGSFAESGGYFWGVLQQKSNDPYALVGNGAYVTNATGSNLMNEAIELPDGSLFAVGGVGTGQGVMVARFVLGEEPSATHEEHAHGGPSMAYSVALDGADRPIVVGSATDGGKQVFGWQRYEAASTVLDETYQDAGLASLAAPSGQGELIATARLGGKVYMLGTYDVETQAPKLALVRIHE